MASTTFVKSTPIRKEWLQDINNFFYGLFSAATTNIQAIAALGLSASSGSSLIGFISDLANAVARTAQSKFREIRSVEDFGAIGDGTTDDYTVIQNGINSMSNGGILNFGPKTYQLSQALSITTNNITLQGSGPSTILRTTSATANTISVTGMGVTIKNIAFSSTVTKSAGSFINLNGASRSTVESVDMDGAFRGISISGGSIVNIKGANIYNTVASTGRGIYITNTPFAASIDSVVMDAPGGSQPEAGIYIDSCGDLVLSRCNIIHSGSALKLVPGNSQVIASLWADNCFFDTSVRGVDIVPTGSGGIVRSRFSNCWMCSMSQFGVNITAATGTTVAGLHFESCHIALNTNNGFWVQDGTTLKDLSIIGGIIGQNVSGIAFNTAVSDFTISDVSIGAYGGFSANTGYGIVFLGAISNCVVNGNRLFGNTLGTISYGASPGANVRIANNAGYNPEGIQSITVGASPYSYTAGHTSEMIFISGGTVSLVKISGTTVHTQSNVTIPLSAGETAQITYSSAPTMYKYRL